MENNTSKSNRDIATFGYLTSGELNIVPPSGKEYRFNSDFAKDKEEKAQRQERGDEGGRRVEDPTTAEEGGAGAEFF